jgi:hypothetical protein
MRAHAESINLEFEKDISEQQVGPAAAAQHKPGSSVCSLAATVPCLKNLKDLKVLGMVVLQALDALAHFPGVSIINDRAANRCVTRCSRPVAASA